MITIDALTDLLMKHLQGSLSPSEQEQLTQWRSESERNHRLFESVSNEEQLRELVLLFQPEKEQENEAAILLKIRQGTGGTMGKKTVRRISLPRRLGWVAACVALMAGIGCYILVNMNTPAPSAMAEKQADIPPGKEGAVLILADGSKVVLDTLQNGLIATQKGINIVLNNGQLAYAMGEGAADAVYNTLTTPKGRQFQLSLPDGTRVWLNAASSLRYPTVFSGSERRVEVTGEVYFEVAEHANFPFTVNVDNRAQIEVLGTQFNVNAYSNETAIRTTLLKGSVKVSVSAGSLQKPAAVVLRPGQQAQIVSHGETTTAQQSVKVLNNADIDQAVAWKSGLFNFENASLEEVMRQLERWYDIEVVFEKGVPNIRFGGKLRSDISLSGMLKSLQDSEVRFRLEGRKLIVLP